MLGLPGALLCAVAGVAVGAVIRERQYTRLRFLESEIELLGRLRILLMEERMGMIQLLTQCAAQEETLFAKRLRHTARSLREMPLLGLEAAYEKACGVFPLYAEEREERAVMLHLFRQLGNGTAAVREQTVAAALRRLKPSAERAEKTARTGGKLCIQLGLLLGSMLGIALW